MSESESPLHPLLDNPQDLRREYRRRNTLWDLKTCKPEEEGSLLGEGWLVHRRLKRGVKLQRPKLVAERLENKWWVLLYKMGYQEMNEGGQFRIQLKRRKEVLGNASISVYARDDETVIVTRCRAQERLGRLSLKADLEGFGKKTGDIANAVKRFYGNEFKPKILWFYVTENIIWSEQEVEIAKHHNIKRVTEMELPYYTQLVEHLGRASRYQFLAEFLKDQKIPQLEGIRVPATKGRLGGKTFYSFVTTPAHLLKIAFVNHRTLDDPEGHPTYQRLIQKNRLKQIGDFIEQGGYFANNLLINFVKPPRFDILQKDLVTDAHFGHLYLPDTYKSAWVIDGQHRLYGYANLPARYMDDKLMVVAFEGLKKSEEAGLFVTINHEQRPVPKTLLDDLEGQLKWGSEDPVERIGAIAARLIQQLSRDLGSVFYGRFTAEGLRATAKACLTVPQVKLGLKRYGLLGRAIGKAQYEQGPLCGTTDNGTLLRAQKALNLYFSQIANADMTRWDRGREGKVCTNEGTQAFTALLGEMVSHIYKGDLERARRTPEHQLIADVSPLLSPVLDFIKSGVPNVDQTFSVQYGSGGPPEYFFRLANIIKAKEPSFHPVGFDEWQITQSEELQNQADRQLQEINGLTGKHIFAVFRALYGEDRNAYWEKGVISKEIRTRAYEKSLDYPVEDRGPLETYLDFIEFKKIIEQKAHKNLFRDVFHIPEPNEKGVAFAFDWMDKINELRRIPAHRAEGRTYKAEHFGFIDRIWNTLSTRIKAYGYTAIMKREEQ